MTGAAPSTVPRTGMGSLKGNLGAHVPQISGTVTAPADSINVYYNEGLIHYNFFYKDAYECNFKATLNKSINKNL
jgi:hypothetical protein